MIARLTGQIVDVEKRAVVLDVNGVGYRVHALGATLAKTALGQTITVRIYHHRNDDGDTLFGFSNAENLHYFQLLLTVPSVGPRTAMNILDVAPPRTLAQAVAENDIKLLTKVSGVGKKTAERILVELKEKIKATPSGHTPSGDLQDDTITALVSLGFTKTQARSLLERLPRGVKTVEEAVRHALKEKA